MSASSVSRLYRRHYAQPSCRSAAPVSTKQRAVHWSLAFLLLLTSVAAGIAVMTPSSPAFAAALLEDPFDDPDEGELSFSYTGDGMTDPGRRVFPVQPDHEPDLPFTISEMIAVNNDPNGAAVIGYVWRVKNVKVASDVGNVIFAFGGYAITHQPYLDIKVRGTIRGEIKIDATMYTIEPDDVDPESPFKVRQFKKGKTKVIIEDNTTPLDPGDLGFVALSANPSVIALGDGTTLSAQLYTPERAIDTTDGIDITAVTPIARGPVASVNGAASFPPNYVPSAPGLYPLAANAPDYTPDDPNVLAVVEVEELCLSRGKIVYPGDPGYPENPPDPELPYGYVPIDPQSPTVTIHAKPNIDLPDVKLPSSWFLRVGTDGPIAPDPSGHPDDTKTCITLDATTPGERLITSGCGLSSRRICLVIYEENQIDLDIDSDQDNGLDMPDRSFVEDKIEDVFGTVTRPGKILMVNDYDTDLDEVPDFADGYDIFGQSGVDASQPFTPLIVSVSEDVDLSTTRIMLTYSASNPGGVTRTGSEEEGYEYTPAPGQMRIWTQDGTVSRFKDSFLAGGNFIPSGVEIPLDAIAPMEDGDGRTWRFYIEAIDVSSTVADATIRLDVTGVSNLPAGEDYDQVRCSIVNYRYVRLIGGKSFVPVDEISYSNPTPTITLSNCEVTNLRAREDGFGIVGDVQISGSVASAVCDMTPGAQGVIDTVQVTINDNEYPVDVINLVVTKDTDPDDWLSPFPYSGTFSETIVGVELGEGGNQIAISAADKIFGMPGSAEAVVTVEATPPAPVEVDYSKIGLSVDFGAVTALDQIDETTPVTVIAAYEGVTHQGVFLQSEDNPLMFVDGAAWLLFPDEESLNNALDPANRGRLGVMMWIPQVARALVDLPMQETTVDSSVLINHVVDIQADLPEQFDDAVVDSIVARVRLNHGGWAEATLTETGVNTFVFENADGTYRVQLTPVQGALLDMPAGPRFARLGNAHYVMPRLLALITPSDNYTGEVDYAPLGLDSDPFSISVTGSGSYETGSTLLTDDVPVGYTDFTFDTPEPTYFPDPGGEGDFHLYSVQVLGPDELLVEIDGFSFGGRDDLIVLETDNSEYLVGLDIEYANWEGAPPPVSFIQPGMMGLGFDASYEDLASLDHLFTEMAGIGNGHDGLGWYLIGIVEGIGIGIKCLFTDTWDLCVMVAEWGVDRIKRHPGVLTIRGWLGEDVSGIKSTNQGDAELAKKIGEILWELMQASQNHNEAVLTEIWYGEWEEAWNIASEPMRAAMEILVEIWDAIEDELHDMDARQIGRIYGRICFEVLSVVATLGAGSIAHVGKLSWLTKLKNVRFFTSFGRGAPILARLQPLLDLARTTRMCFEAGTPVQTIAGVRPIEDIRAGDWVLSRHPETMQMAYRPVVERIITNPTTLYHIVSRPRQSHRVGRGWGAGGSSDDGDSDSSDDPDSFMLTCTGEHPFFIEAEERFVPASELAVGDLLTLANGNQAEIVELSVEHAPEGETFTTYNFEVDGYHTYFVGEAGGGVWVHNLAATCERIATLFHRFATRDNLLPWDAWKKFLVHLNDPAKPNRLARMSSHLRHAAREMSLKMFQHADGDLTKLVSYTAARSQTANHLRRTSIEAHHLVPRYVQEILGIPAHRLDEVPAFMMHAADHRRSLDNFHTILYRHIPRRHWRAFDEAFPNGLDPDLAKDALRAAYLEWARTGGRNIPEDEMEGVLKAIDAWIDAEVPAP